LLAFYFFRLSRRHPIRLPGLLLLLLTPDLLLLRHLLLTPYLLLLLSPDLRLRSRLLVNSFLFTCLPRRHSIFLLTENLLRLGLRLLSLLPSTASAIATTASRGRTALMLFLSRRPSATVRIAAAMPFTLSKYVLI